MNTPRLYAVLAAVFGGSVPIFAKYGLEVFPPFTLVVLRFFSASIVLLPFVIQEKGLTKYKLLHSFLPGFVGALNPILLFIALVFTQASVSPLIYASVPAMAVIHQYLKGRRLSKRKSLGVILGLGGVAVIVLLPLIESANIYKGSFLGNILIFVAAISFYFYSTISQEKQQKYHISPITLTFYFCVISGLLALPLGVYQFIIAVEVGAIRPVHIFASVAVGVIGTSMFYLVYQYALKSASTLTASLFTFLQPLATIIFAVIFLGEVITTPFIIGGIMAIVGAKLASAK